MEGNIVKLVFKSIAAGSGFAKVDEQTSSIMKKMGKMGQGAQVLGRTFGDLGGTIGQAVGMFMQGGVWGAAAHVVSILIDKTGILRDKTEEITKALDEQRKAHERLLSSITTGYKDAISTIDDEARKRNEMIELTKRQTKAQLELKRAQAIMSGDTSTANAVEDELSKADQKSAVDAAEAGVRDAEKKVKAARDALATAQKLARESDAKVERTRAELDAKSTPQTMIMHSSAGAFVQTTNRDTTAERKALESAYEEKGVSDKKLEEARKALKIELEGLMTAKEARKTALLEQEAAEKKAIADREKEEKKSAAQTAKEKAKKEEEERLATVKRQKEIDLKYEDEKAKRDKEEKQKQFEEDKRFEVKQSQKKLEDLRKREDLYRSLLADANRELPRAWEAYRDPSKLNQKEERRQKRQKEIDEKRFEKDSESLMKRKDWRTTDKLSNRERATRDLILAKEKEDNAKDNLKKIDDDIIKLIKKIEELTSL